MLIKMRGKFKKKKIWKTKVQLKRSMRRHDWNKRRMLEYIYAVTFILIYEIYIVFILYYIIFFILLYYFVCQKLALTEK